MFIARRLLDRARLLALELRLVCARLDSDDLLRALVRHLDAADGAHLLALQARDSVGEDLQVGVDAHTGAARGDHRRRHDRVVVVQREHAALSSVALYSKRVSSSSTRRVSRIALATLSHGTHK